MTDETGHLQFNTDGFRAAMRAFASSVTVITSNHAGHMHGMTATAISSVTADPPTVLIVVNKSTRSHPLITAGKAFAVNILAQTQTRIGELFSAKRDDLFDGVPHSIGMSGAPVIDGVVAHLDCETVFDVSYSTHTIFIARVVGGAVAPGTDPLLYHDGQFKALAALPPHGGGLKPSHRSQPASIKKAV